MESARTCERDFLRGVAKFACSHGHWAFYRKPRYYIKPDKRQLSVAKIRDYKPDGIIVSDTENYQQIAALGIAVIVHTVKSRVKGLPSIVGDCDICAKMAARHLLDNGYKNFAFAGLGDYFWSKDRYRNFKTVVNQAGFEVRLFELPSQPRGSVRIQQDRLLGWVD